MDTDGAKQSEDREFLGTFEPSLPSDARQRLLVLSESYPCAHGAFSDA